MDESTTLKLTQAYLSQSMIIPLHNNDLVLVQQVNNGAKSQRTDNTMMSFPHQKEGPDIS